jgi:excinuclease ABC subunit B
LKCEEFEKKGNNIIFVSATPGDYELEKVNGKVSEQIIRPTGLIDPKVSVVSKTNQIDDIVERINNRISKNERTLITTLTIRMAEDLTAYLKNLGYKVAYLHSETKTLERTQIIYELRKGKYDVLVGINLLREGLDIPEVSQVLILDADSEGFLRSSRSLIQIIGRASRNANGEVIMYADTMTDSMKAAITETDRRRNIQMKYNEENNIIPQTIIKEIKEPIKLKEDYKDYVTSKSKKISKKEKEVLLLDLEKEMKQAAKELDFERAMQLRDIIFELKSDII